LRDLALRASQITVRLAANNEDRRRQAHVDASKLLEELEEFSGPSKVLEVERILHGKSLESLDQLAQPTSAAEYHQFGRAYWSAGKLDRAEQCFERGTVLEPRSLALHFDRATLAFQRSRYDEAAESFRACLAIQPNPVGYSRLAFAYLARAEVARKAASFRTGLAIQPYPFGYSWLGFTYLAHADMVRMAARDEDLNRAELNFTEAIRRAGQIDGRPGLAEALFGRGQVNHRRKDYSNALNDLTKALEAGYPRAKGLYTIAVVHLDAGKRGKAMASNKDALAAQRDFAPALALDEQLTKRPDPQTP
jgi:tetratricopeptide (TPR) repeat protein